MVPVATPTVAVPKRADRKALVVPKVEVRRHAALKVVAPKDAAQMLADQTDDVVRKGAVPTHAGPKVAGRNAADPKPVLRAAMVHAKVLAIGSRRSVRARKVAATRNRVNRTAATKPRRAISPCRSSSRKFGKPERRSILTSCSNSSNCSIGAPHSVLKSSFAARSHGNHVQVCTGRTPKASRLVQACFFARARRGPHNVDQDNHERRYFIAIARWSGRSTFSIT
jgi:hypothetical protein